MISDLTFSFLLACFDEQRLFKLTHLIIGEILNVIDACHVVVEALPVQMLGNIFVDHPLINEHLNEISTFYRGLNMLLLANCVSLVVLRILKLILECI